MQSNLLKPVFLVLVLFFVFFVDIELTNRDDQISIEGTSICHRIFACPLTFTIVFLFYFPVCGRFN